MENGKPLDEPFYFYSTNNNIQTDVNTLMPIIDGSQTGTYKQQLNREIIQDLKNYYKNCTNKGTTFTLQVGATNTKYFDMPKNRIITLADRDLRDEAHISIKGINSDDYLVHHKVKGEFDNDYKNLILISKNSGLDVAHAVHKFLENRNYPYSRGTTSVQLMEYNPKSATWVPGNVIDITIK